MLLLTAFIIYVLVNFLLLTFTSSLMLCSQKRAKAGAESPKAKKGGPLKAKKEVPDKMVQPPRVVIKENGEVSYEYRRSKEGTATSKASRGSTSTEVKKTGTTLSNARSNLCKRREMSNSHHSRERSAHVSSLSRDAADTATATN